MGNDCKSKREQNLFRKWTKSNNKHAQCFYYLYKIAEKNNQITKQKEYKKIVMQLDENLFEGQ